MLVGSSEPPRGALEGLSPSDRALLELSLRRHVPDDEVAALLRSDREEVERKRASLLRHVAHELGLGSTDEAAEALLAGWGVAEEPAAAAAPAAEEPATEERERKETRARRTRPLILLALLALAAIAGIVLLTRGGEEQPPPPVASKPKPSPKPQPAATPQTPAPQSAGAALTPVAGADAQASVSRLEDGILRLRIDRLPPGDYTVWLYDSVSDAAPLVRFQAASGKVDIKMPADSSRYRFLDVSREPRDGNPNHSGASVLRVPVQQALAAR